jgi:hypothetical protein
MRAITVQCLLLILVSSTPAQAPRQAESVSGRVIAIGGGIARIFCHNAFVHDQALLLVERVNESPQFVTVRFSYRWEGATEDVHALKASNLQVDQSRTIRSR